MGDCLKNLFVQQFDSFMAEHGYKQNINCFSKLYNDIFARVYLFYHYDKNCDELLQQRISCIVTQLTTFCLEEWLIHG